MIGELDVVAIDCPDALGLAGFYAEVLGWEVATGDDGAAETAEAEWVEIGPGGGETVLAFQRVEGYRAPEWPGQVVPQQMHVDVRVASLDEGERAVLALGATRAGYDRPTFRVYLDPVGHPFCLVSSNG